MTYDETQQELFSSALSVDNSNSYGEKDVKYITLVFLINRLSFTGIAHRGVTFPTMNKLEQNYYFTSTLVLKIKIKTIIPHVH